MPGSWQDEADVLPPEVVHEEPFVRVHRDAAPVGHEPAQELRALLENLK